MKIENKLTLRHLKETKRRSIITVLGIIVSVAMITAVFVSATSFLDYFGRVAKLEDGDYAFYYITDEAKYNSVKTNPDVSDVGLKSDNCMNFRLESGSKPRNSTGSITSMNKAAFRQLVQVNIEGTLPQNTDDILVERSLIQKNNLDWKIGDTVTVPVGNRVVTDDDTGETYEIDGRYQYGEEFQKTGTRTFKLVGIVNENYPTYFSASILRLAPDSELLGEKATAYVSFRNYDNNTHKTIQSLIKSIDVDSKTIVVNQEYLLSFGDYTQSYTLKTLLPAIIMILVIIMAASVMLIYNAFAMSLSERVRYLGMLASVGATKAQKRRSVYFESIIFGLIGIPFGIGFGILGIFITLKLIGNKIVESAMFSGSESVAFQTKVPLVAIIGIIIVSIITIMISSYIPARKASKITPIDAIRQQSEIKVKAKNLRSSKLIRKVFGYEGEIANKNIKRNGRKGRLTVASIALSVVLFLSVNYFCSMFVTATNMANNSVFEVITVTSSSKDAYSLKQDVEAMNNVNKTIITSDSYNIKLKSDLGDIDSSINSLLDESIYTKYGKKLLESKPRLCFIYVEDEEFDAFVSKSGLNPKNYYKENDIVLIKDILNGKKVETVYNDSVIGKKIKLGNTEYNIAAVANYNDSSITQLCVPGTIIAVAPLSTLGDKTSNYQLMIKTDNHKQIKDDIIKIIDTGRFSKEIYIIDQAEQLESINTIIFIMQVFIYGFITLITLITVANIMNTISTGVELRKKEFAMLKSVGTTPKGMRKIIVFESLLYGIKALIVAIPLSIIISLLMVAVIGEESISFTLNLPLYLITVAAVFLIVGVSMLLGLSKLKNSSIVETLKEDIC